MQQCVTCNGKGFMMGPGHEGEPCPVCSMHEIQIAGSGWLKDDGTPLPLVEMYALGKIADPAATVKPELMKDGNMWCALYGPDLQVGIAGFGATQEAALVDFNANWANEFAEPRKMTDDERRAHGILV